MNARRAAVIGGGPAGLMACEQLAAQGIEVDLYDAMPSVGRKFLLAGIGGLNLTHSEPAAGFATRYGSRSGQVEAWLAAFGPDALREWAKLLGIDTFVGTSGRVFPTDMKAAPLLRAWLHRLRVAGVSFHMRHRWLGFAASPSAETGVHRLRFQAPNGELEVAADAVVLALGGGSWARLGSDGAWVPWLQEKGVELAPLRPANCGFDVPWSDHFRERFAGQPVKTVAALHTGSDGRPQHIQGEFVVTATGIEGSLVYTCSATLRDEIEAHGSARLTLDLLPAHTAERVRAEVAHPRGARSFSTHLKSRLGLQGVKAGLLWEHVPEADRGNADVVAAAIKALPLVLTATRPLDEAISTAGGVRLEAMDAALMLHALPGVFCAGEMLDWEAPTGGYLLTACMASGLRAGQSARRWLQGEAKSLA